MVVSAGAIQIAKQCHQVIRDPEKSKLVHGMYKNKHNV